MSPNHGLRSLKERRERSFKRLKATRAPYEVVRIVCEGRKTEPNYFEGLLKEYKLSSADIQICDDKHGTDPRSVVECAVAKIKKDRSIDRIYCVFDRDKHTTFNDAIQKLKGKKKIFRSLSIPCFEIWLLLHFIPTSKQFCVAGDGSNCEEVIKELAKFIPGYQKGKKDIFAVTKDKIFDAIERAKHLAETQRTSGRSLGDCNPLTEVHELVEYLICMKTS